MRPRLRLYKGDEHGQGLAEPQVSMRLGDMTRILEDAISRNRTWLRDFEDDEVHVSSDLYEILTAYAHLRPSA